jgi:endonuclease-3
MADANRIVSLLLKRYPDPRLALNYANPLELLVAVILSAQCTDARVNGVTRSLFKHYLTASHYATADAQDLEEAIRPTGFYRNKAKALIGCCQELVAEFAGEVPDTVEALTKLPGVGRKTANMVLGNAFGKEAIAVDTHVARVTRRLGLAHARDAGKIEMELLAQVPRNRLTAFSNASILHGRETCTARKPHCQTCVLYRACEWPDKLDR